MLTWLKIRIAYIAALAGGLLITFVLPIALETSYCEANRQQNQGNQDQSPSYNINHSFVIFGGASDSYKGKANSGGEPPAQNSEPKAWICDLRLTDLALVFFTWCLVVAGWGGNALRRNIRPQY